MNWHRHAAAFAAAVIAMPILPITAAAGAQPAPGTQAPGPAQVTSAAVQSVEQGQDVYLDRMVPMPSVAQGPNLRLTAQVSAGHLHMPVSTEGVTPVPGFPDFLQDGPTVVAEGKAADLADLLRLVYWTAPPSSGPVQLTVQVTPAGMVRDPVTGHLYTRIPGDATWQEAVAAAHASHVGPAYGYLATLTRPAEQELVDQFLPGLAWAGGQVADGVVHWADGPEAGTAVSAAGYSNWAAGQPDLSGGQHLAVGADGTWSLQDSGQRSAYLAEYGDGPVEDVTVGASAATVVVYPALVPPSWTSVDLPDLARTGDAYSGSIRAAGEPAPTYDIASGTLPPGLTLDPTSGDVTGTTTQDGAYDFTIRASSPAGMADRPMSIFVTSEPTYPPSWAGDSLPPGGKVGTPYSAVIEATAFPPARYGLQSSSLPDGLSLDAVTGAITGTPTASGTFPVTLRAHNSLGSIDLPVVMYIEPADAPCQWTTWQVPPTGKVPNEYTGAASAAGYPTCEHVVTSGAIPEGVQLDPVTGTLYGYPIAEGVYTFTLTARNRAGEVSRSATVQVAAADVSPSWTIVEVPATGTVAKAYTGTLKVLANPAAVFTVTGGALPAGLTLDPSTGALTGAPQEAGEFQFTVTAANEVGHTDRAFTLVIEPADDSPQYPFDPTDLPTGAVGVLVNESIKAQGGYPIPAHSLTAGTLPPGVSLDPSGVLAGKPTAGGMYTFTVTAANRAGSSSRSFSLRVVDLSAPVYTPPVVSGGAPATVDLSSLPSGTVLIVDPQVASSTPGVAEVRVTGRKLVIQPTAAFAGTVRLPVVISYAGIVRQATVSATVRPSPAGAITIVRGATAPGVTISWKPSANATEYRVAIDGREVAVTLGEATVKLPRVLRKGQNITVTAAAAGMTATATSTPVPSALAAFGTVAFAKGSATLSKPGKAQLARMLTQMRAAGFTEAYVAGMSVAEGTSARMRALTAARARVAGAYLSSIARGTFTVKKAPGLAGSRGVRVLVN